jgi:hypothetical protein
MLCCTYYGFVLAKLIGIARERLWSRLRDGPPETAPRDAARVDQARALKTQTWDDDHGARVAPVLTLAAPAA